MTEIQNSHGRALSAQHLGFRRIYFRKRKETRSLQNFMFTDTVKIYQRL